LSCAASLAASFDTLVPAAGALGPAHTVSYMHAACAHVQQGCFATSWPVVSGVC
jgi:hypothetical protein